MTEPLDDQKLEALRVWGEHLAEDGRDELRAAGRAILFLIAEVERLRPPAPRPDAERDVVEPELQAGLRGRLAQLARR